MTPHELAFRHIAENDFDGRFFPRSLPELVTLCARKGLTDENAVAEAIRAYFDEVAQEQAHRLGFCRLCRVARPMHWHTEPIIRAGSLSEKLVACNAPLCLRPISSAAAVCLSCSHDYRQFVRTKHAIRRERLLRRGANVPQAPAVR